MSRQTQVSFLNNGRNISLKDTTFNTTILDHGSQTSGIHILSQVISRSAMHDSFARCPPPRCHPDTREWAIATIITFVKDPDPEDVVLWMHAPFGHGKSAVMQTAIELLKASEFSHYVGGGFFFGRGKPGRDKAHYLLPTILYQIAINIPGMRDHINDALNADPSLPHKSIGAQLYPLLVAPFQRQSHHTTHTPTIFIDGLDECDTMAAQRSVLKMIADAISHYKLPLRFVVASRPESHIIACFKAEPLSSITGSFELDDDFESMTKCLRDGFEEIYNTHPDVMDGIAKPWPSSNILHDLVRRASGQYLFIFTVISFVGDEYANPLEQLELVLSPDPRRPSAFTGMDALYTQILSVCRVWDRERLIRILAAMLVLRNCTVAALSDLLELTVADILTVIRSLRSIIDIEDMPTLPPTRTKFHITNHISPKLSIRHISFEEFITDKSRAGDFWVDQGAMQKALIQSADSLLSRSISGSTVTIHPLTWDCIYSLADRPPKYYILDDSTWPLFTKEFARLESTRLMLVSGLQQTRAFRFLNDHWSLLGRDISDTGLIKGRLVAALHKRLELLSQDNQFGFFDFVRHLRYNTAGDRLEGTVEDVSHKSNIALDTVLRTIEETHSFLDFRTRAGAMLVLLNRKTIDMLEDPAIVGPNTHLAFRDARILALRDLHEDLIINKDTTWIMEEASFCLKSEIWRLKDKVDDISGSAMSSFIKLIRSPRFQNVLLDPGSSILVDPDYVLWFLIFFGLQCGVATTLGPGFQKMREKQIDLIKKVLSKGALTTAFAALAHKFAQSSDHKLDTEYNGVILYLLLFHDEFGGVGKHLLDVVGGSAHTAALEHFLDIEWIMVLASGMRQAFNSDFSSRNVIFWSEHFSGAANSPKILENLLAIHRNWQDFKKLVPFYLNPDFVSGVRTWAQKHLDPTSDSAHMLRGLCTGILDIYETRSPCSTDSDSTDDESERNRLGEHWRSLDDSDHHSDVIDNSDESDF